MPPSWEEMMTKLSDLIDETQSHHVTVKNSSGKVWFTLSLFWALLILNEP